MSPAVLDREPVAAREQERPNLAKLEDLFAHLDPESATNRLRLVSPGGEEIELPESVFRLMHQMVYELAQGNSVTIVPVHKVLTTTEAADVLNVSRQYLVELLDAGAIPFIKVGTHRRIQFGDLMEYKKQRDATRREGLSRLTGKTGEREGVGCKPLASDMGTPIMREAEPHRILARKVHPLTCIK